MLDHPFSLISKLPRTFPCGPALSVDVRVIGVEIRQKSVWLAHYV